MKKILSLLILIIFSCNKNEVKYDAIFKPSEGMRLVVHNKKSGFINTENKLTVPLEYDGAWDFSNGLARVYKRYKSYKKPPYEFRWGFVDKNGVEVIPLIYDSAEPFQNGVAKVLKDGKSYYFDNRGRSVTKSNERDFKDNTITEQIYTDDIIYIVATVHYEYYSINKKTSSLEPFLEYEGDYCSQIQEIKWGSVSKFEEKFRAETSNKYIAGYGAKVDFKTYNINRFLSHEDAMDFKRNFCTTEYEIAFFE